MNPRNPTEDLIANFTAMNATVGALAGALKGLISPLNDLGHEMHQLVQQIKSMAGGFKGMFGRVGGQASVAGDLVGATMVARALKTPAAPLLQNYVARSGRSGLQAGNNAMAQGMLGAIFGNQSQKALPLLIHSHPFKEWVAGIKDSVTKFLSKGLQFQALGATALTGLKSVLTGFWRQGVLGVLAVFVTSAVAAVQSLKGNLTAQMLSGGIGQGGAIHGLASRLGMSDLGLGERARAFGDLLTNGGIPAGIAAQIGIKPYGGLGGDRNYFNKFRTALKYITDPSGDIKQQTLAAQMFGMEDMMWLRSADKKHQAMVFDSPWLKNGPEEATKAANSMIEFNAAMANFMDALKNLGIVVLPMLTDLLNNVWTTLIGAVIGFLMGGPVGAAIGGAAGWGVGHAGGWVRDQIWGDKNTAKDATVENHTKAMQGHVDALNAHTTMMNGSYGFGSIGNSGVVPRGWGMQTFSDRAQGMAIALGAFSI